MCVCGGGGRGCGGMHLLNDTSFFFLLGKINTTDLCEKGE